MQARFGSDKASTAVHLPNSTTQSPCQCILLANIPTHQASQPSTATVSIGSTCPPHPQSPFCHFPQTPLGRDQKLVPLTGNARSDRQTLTVRQLGCKALHSHNHAHTHPASHAKACTKPALPSAQARALPLYAFKIVDWHAPHYTSSTLDRCSAKAGVIHAPHAHCMPAQSQLPSLAAHLGAGHVSRPVTAPSPR